METNVKKTASKKLLWVVVVLIVAAAAVIMVDRSYKPTTELASAPASRSNGDSGPQGVQALIKPMPVEQIPDNLPDNLPLEKGATITQNYQAQAGDRMQSTRQYISSKSLQENFNVFLSFLNKNKWTLLASSSQEQDMKVLTAQKDENILDVVFNHNPIQDKNYVDVSLTYPAASPIQP